MGNNVVSGDRMVTMVTIENVNHPNYRGRANADKDEAMRMALLLAPPDRPPDLTQLEMTRSVSRTAGWWAKTAQLDLEAKGIVIRHPEKPPRWTNPVV